MFGSAVCLKLHNREAGVLHDNVVELFRLNLLLQQCPSCFIIVLSLLKSINSLSDTLTMQVLLLLVEQWNKFVGHYPVIGFNHAIAS